MRLLCFLLLSGLLCSFVSSRDPIFAFEVGDLTVFGYAHCNSMDEDSGMTIPAAFESDIPLGETCDQMMRFGFYADGPDDAMATLPMVAVGVTHNVACNVINMGDLKVLYEMGKVEVAPGANDIPISDLEMRVATMPNDCVPVRLVIGVIKDSKLIVLGGRAMARGEQKCRSPVDIAIEVQKADSSMERVEVEVTVNADTGRSSFMLADVIASAGIAVPENMPQQARPEFAPYIFSAHLVSKEFFYEKEYEKRDGTWAEIPAIDDNSQNVWTWSSTNLAAGNVVDVPLTTAMILTSGQDAKGMKYCPFCGEVTLILAFDFVPTIPDLDRSNNFFKIDLMLVGCDANRHKYEAIPIIDVFTGRLHVKECTACHNDFYLIKPDDRDVGHYYHGERRGMLAMIDLIARTLRRRYHGVTECSEFFECEKKSCDLDSSSESQCKNELTKFMEADDGEFNDERTKLTQLVQMIMDNCECAVLRERARLLQKMINRGMLDSDDDDEDVWRNVMKEMPFEFGFGDPHEMLCPTHFAADDVTRPRFEELGRVGRMLKEMIRREMDGTDPACNDGPSAYSCEHKAMQAFAQSRYWEKTGGPDTEKFYWFNETMHWLWWDEPIDRSFLRNCAVQDGPVGWTAPETYIDTQGPLILHGVPNVLLNGRMCYEPVAMTRCPFCDDDESMTPPDYCDESRHDGGMDGGSDGGMDWGSDGGMDGGSGSGMDGGADGLSSGDDTGSLPPRTKRSVKMTEKKIPSVQGRMAVPFRNKRAPAPENKVKRSRRNAPLKKTLDTTKLTQNLREDANKAFNFAA